MTSSKLDRIGGFMKRWIKGIMFFGYNVRGVECFYILDKSGTSREVPFSWELIQDNGLVRAWDQVKDYLAKTHSFAYDYKSDMIIHSGAYGV